MTEEPRATAAGGFEAALAELLAESDRREAALRECLARADEAEVARIANEVASPADLARREPTGEPARAEVEALLRSQQPDGGWTDADGGDATARALDDGLAIALLAESPDPRATPPVALAVVRALSRLASTQGPAGDWQGDLLASIATLRAAILFHPLVEARFPAALEAVGMPANSRGGRFLERGLAWCLSRRPDDGRAAARAAGEDPEAALRLARAAAGLLRDYDAWRSAGPLGPARRRGLA